MMVGPPGSGKSSYIRKYLPHALRLSLDDLRLMLSRPAVRPALRADGLRVGRHAHAGNAIQVEGVAQGLRIRRDECEPRTAGAHLGACRGVRFCRPSRSSRIPRWRFALARNRRRRRKVPEEVIERFYRLLEPPSIDEGFEEVVAVRDW